MFKPPNKKEKKGYTSPTLPLSQEFVHSIIIKN